MAVAPAAAATAAGWARGPARVAMLALGGLMAAGASLTGAAGCSSPCCSTDGYPIDLMARTDQDVVGLVAQALQPQADPAAAFTMSVDTGSALTYFRRHSEGNQVVLRDFDVLDAQPPAGVNQPVVRGRFRSIEVLPLDLRAGGPDAVFGGALLQNFSVQFDFAKPAVTFWSRQGASDGFLNAAGFAVIHFNLAGGAELTAESRPDFLGLTGPVEVPPTRVVLRGCGAPAAFDPAAIQPESCCARSDAVTKATGQDLALVLATGVGPVVLSQSAWDRLAGAQVSPPPSPTPGAALPIPSLSAVLTEVSWSTLPRLALVNQELDDANNPGACVELGRARRLEWLENHQTACVQPCDSDVSDTTKAQNGAAYVELGTDIPVAVIPDSTSFLQGLRAEIRPEGPEIDGLIGANAFAGATVEIDYQNKPGRAVVACAPNATRSICFASPRCPRLVNPGDSRSCFGLPPRSLPSSSCQPAVCP